MDILPEEGRIMLNALLDDVSVSYAVISERLKDRGWSISVSSIHRYARKRRQDNEAQISLCVMCRQAVQTRASLDMGDYIKQRVQTSLPQNTQLCAQISDIVNEAIYQVTATTCKEE